MKRFYTIALCFLLGLLSMEAQHESLMKLWYKQSNNQSEESIPVGNSQLTTTVYVDSQNEIVQLNKSIIWNATININDNTNAFWLLPQVKKLIYIGKYKDAQDIIGQHFSVRNVNGILIQKVGDLRLDFPYLSNIINYTCELDIKTGIVSIKYMSNDVHYKMHVFSSFPDRVIRVRIYADKKGALTFSASMEKSANDIVDWMSYNLLTKPRNVNNKECQVGNEKFNSKVKVVTKKGDVSYNDSMIIVKNATDVILYNSL